MTGVRSCLVQLSRKKKPLKSHNTCIVFTLIVLSYNASIISSRDFIGIIRDDFIISAQTSFRESTGTTHDITLLNIPLDVIHTMPPAPIHIILRSVYTHPHSLRFFFPSKRLIRFYGIGFFFFLRAWHNKKRMYTIRFFLYFFFLYSLGVWFMNVTHNRHVNRALEPENNTAKFTRIT